jgi:hypothetical protein
MTVLEHLTDAERAAFWLEWSKWYLYRLQAG